jgi:hypothetical protein
MAKQKLYIGVNIDWSKSFVDPNGGFYCGTTDEQKALAAKLMPYLDLVINTTDFHSINSREFKINGGLWPLHNVAEFRRIKVTDYGLKEGTTISPEQTEVINKMINKTKSGIIVPKHVYFQDSKKLSFTPETVEEALQERIITADEFLRENFTYIISPKMHFDGTAEISQILLPQDKIPRVPNLEFTVFDLIEEKYGKKREEEIEIVYVNTGVLDNICRHYTSTGLKQKYGHRVVNIIGATTELYGVGLGFEERHQTRLACERIQKDIGVEHKTLDEMIYEIKA